MQAAAGLQRQEAPDSERLRLPPGARVEQIALPGSPVQGVPIATLCQKRKKKLLLIAIMNSYY